MKKDIGNVQLTNPESTMKIMYKIVLIFILAILLQNCRKDTSEPSPAAKYFSDYDFEEPAVSGSTFYIDPENGSPEGDGSRQHPWKTLQAVIDSNLIEYYKHAETNNDASELVAVNAGAPVKGGDKLVLLSGYHGFVNLSNFIFKDWLTIAGEKGATPVLSRFSINGAFKNIYLKNFSIIKDSYVGAEDYWVADDINHNSNACLYLASNSFRGSGSDIKINCLTVKTTNDASSWTAADWVDKAASGISLRSVEHAEVVNCDVENIRHGILFEYFSDNGAAVNNVVKNFSGDGSRIISNNILFAYNTITGCLKVDDNHDDGIQSYSRGADNSPGTGVLYNVTIRGNIIIGINNKNNPLSASPQGIGCFDGFFDNWVVENNIIISNTYHGISFYGMRNGRILNNTVIDQVPGDDVSPWIMVTDHKNGTKSENCIVANNIASASVSASGNNVTAGNNYVFGKNNYDSIYFAFTDPDNNDLHLLVNDFTKRNIIDKGIRLEGFVSAGMDRGLSERDNVPDLGAYEAQE